MGTVISTDNGPETISKMLAKIRRASASKKDAIYLSCYGKDRQMLLEEAILRLPKKTYTLDIESKAAQPITKVIQEMYGVMASVDVTEKLIRGLSVIYPSKIQANLTLGLQEIHIGKRI